MQKTDAQLKKDIEEELAWDPIVNRGGIGVTVHEGAVSLQGAVNTWAGRQAVEAAVRRVRGVRSVEQRLTVQLREEHRRSDADIAAAAQAALQWDVFVPKTVTAKVQNGILTLEGQVSWNYQRHAADRATRYLAGVIEVTNSISLLPQALASDVREKVEAALHRQATVDADSIHIETQGGRVTLTGHASSWQSIEDASNAAWASPGVTEVFDQVRMSMMPAVRPAAADTKLP